MDKQEKPKPDKQPTTEELERRAKAEGLDLEHPEGQERFEGILKKAAKPKG